MTHIIKEHVLLFFAVALFPLAAFQSTSFASSQRSSKPKKAKPKETHYQIRGDVQRLKKDSGQMIGRQIRASIHVNHETGQSRLILETGNLLSWPSKMLGLPKSIHSWEKTEIKGTTKISNHNEKLFKDYYDVLPKAEDMQERVLIFTPEKFDRIVADRAFYLSLIHI